jgi:hypothetical protein
MTTGPSLSVLALLLLFGASTSSLAIERDRLKDQTRWNSDKSSGTAAVSADPKEIAKLIDDINAAARKNKERMLSIIVINTDVAASTLEKQKAESGLTFGDIYVAHSLALATKKKFSAIMALKKSGKSWAEIARSHHVSLKGSRELIKEMQRQ